MSETQTEVVKSNDEVDAEEIIKNSPFHKGVTIVRNGITAVLKNFVGQRGEWKDKPYPAFQIEVDSSKGIADDHQFMKDITFIGKDNVKNYINTILRRVGQDYVDDSINQEGVFSIDALIKSWENLAAAGLKLSELKELLDAEQRKHEAYIAGEGMEFLTSGDTHKMKIAKDTIENRTKNIKALRFELEQRAARRSKEAATETVMAN